MAELDRLFVRVLGDITDLEAKMSKADKVVSQAADKMSAAGKGLTIGLTLPLGIAGVAAVKAAADMDRLRRGLTAVTGSTQEAERQLKRLEQVARLPGLGFREAIRGSTRLQASFGEIAGRAQLAEDILRGFGNAIAIAGGGSAQLDQVTRALGQIAAKGKVSAEEINQIAEAIPQIRVVMEEIFGTANTEELQQRNLDAIEFIRGITDGLLELDTVTGGVANSFENLSDAFFRARVAIGEQLLPFVTPLVEGLAAMLEEAQDLDPGMVRLGLSLGAALAVAGPLTVAISALTTAIVALKVAGASLLLTFGVGGLIIGGLSVLVGLFVKSKLEAAAFAAEVKKLGDTAKSAARNLEGLNQAQTLTTLGNRRKALEDLVRLREQLIRETQRPTTLGPVSIATQQQQEDLRQLDKAIATVKGSIAGLEDRYIALANAAQEGAEVTDDLGVSTGRLTPVFEQTEGNVSRLVDAITRAHDELGDLRFDLAFETAADAAADLRGEIETLTDRITLMGQALDAVLDQAFAEAGAPTIGVIAPSAPLAPPGAIGGDLQQQFDDLVASMRETGTTVEALTADQRAIIDAMAERRRSVAAVNESIAEATGGTDGFRQVLGDIGAAFVGLGSLMQNSIGRVVSGLGSAITSLLASTNPVTAAIGVFGGVVQALGGIFGDAGSNASRLADSLRGLNDSLRTTANLRDLDVQQRFEEAEAEVQRRLGRGRQFFAEHPGHFAASELADLFEQDRERFFEVVDRLAKAARAGSGRAAAILTGAFGDPSTDPADVEAVIAFIENLESLGDRANEAAERASAEIERAALTPFERLRRRFELFDIPVEEQFEQLKEALANLLPDQAIPAIAEAQIGDMDRLLHFVLSAAEAGFEAIGGVPIDQIIQIVTAMEQLGDQAGQTAAEVIDAVALLRERRAAQLDLLHTRFELLDIPIDRQAERIQAALTELLPPELAGVLERDFDAFALKLITLARNAIAQGEEQIFGVDVSLFLSLATELDNLKDQSEQAADELGRVSSEILNAPAGFKVALERFRATIPGLGDTRGPPAAREPTFGPPEPIFIGPPLREAPAPAPPRQSIGGNPRFRGTQPRIDDPPIRLGPPISAPPPRIDPVVPPIILQPIARQPRIRPPDPRIDPVPPGDTFNIGEINAHIDAGERDPEELWREIQNVARREAKRGGTSQFDVRKV